VSGAVGDDDPQTEPDDAAFAALVRRWAYAAVASREMSAVMLARRLADKASRRFPEREPETIRTAVEAAVAACVGHGFVDDARFADLSIRGGVARGHSRRRIALTLKEKGVADLDGLAGVDDLAGALRLLRRRRLGPWAAPEDEAEGGGRARPASRAEERALGLLLRNGFGLETARRALALPLDEAEEKLAG
jgi:regulatory protein